MSKISDIYAKPNRRIRGQRRTGNQDRRRQSIWVANCRRSGSTDRRITKDRRPGGQSEWITVKTINPIKAKFVTQHQNIDKGRLINISI